MSDFSDPNFYWGNEVDSSSTPTPLPEKRPLTEKEKKEKAKFEKQILKRHKRINRKDCILKRIIRKLRGKKY